METYNLYKKGRYGLFHVTAFKFDSLKSAIDFYKKHFNIKIGNDLFQYKVTGL